MYPETSPQQIPILYFVPLLKAASKSGFDEKWLTANSRAAKFAINDPAVTKGRFTGQKAFERWAGCFEQARKSQESPDAGTLLSSLHAAVYLANTRTLAWMSVVNGDGGLPAGDKALTLLQTEVNTANELAGRIIRLFVGPVNQPCNPYQDQLDGIIDRINTIQNIEKDVLNEGLE